MSTYRELWLQQVKLLNANLPSNPTFDQLYEIFWLAETGVSSLQMISGSIEIERQQAIQSFQADGEVEQIAKIVRKYIASLIDWAERVVPAEDRNEKTMNKVGEQSVMLCE